MDRARWQPQQHRWRQIAYVARMVEILLHDSVIYTKLGSARALKSASCRSLVQMPSSIFRVGEVGGLLYIFSRFYIFVQNHFSSFSYKVFAFFFCTRWKFLVLLCGGARPAFSGLIAFAKSAQQYWRNIPNCRLRNKQHARAPSCSTTSLSPVLPR